MNRSKRPSEAQPICMETCNDYSDDEAAFLREVEAFKKKHGRRFISLVEGVRVWEAMKAAHNARADQ